MFLIAKGHLDLFAGLGGAPDGDELLLLEHHALAENGGQGDVGAGCGGKEKREEKGAIHGKGNDL